MIFSSTTIPEMEVEYKCIRSTNGPILIGLRYSLSSYENMRSS